MLVECHIHNFTIIEATQLQFAHHMTALTGETGAGKSILVDALGLVLGHRADTKWIRPGQERTEITATFQCPPDTTASIWLREQDLDQEDQCIIRRIIQRDGKSKAYINGRPATVQQLKALGQYLVLIHGQHEHHALMKPTYQRERLDHFAHHESLAEQVQQAYQHWHSAHQQLTEHRQATEQQQAQLELLRYQVAELETLNLQAEEIEQLYQEQKQLSHGQQLQQHSGQILAQLQDDDHAIIDVLDHATRQLNELVTIDARLTPVVAMLEESRITLQEAATELHHYHDNIELDPERLQQVESRLEVLHDIARKHQVRAQDLFDHYQTLCDQLQALDQSHGDLAALEAKCQQHQATWSTAAQQLSTQRQQAAAKLAKAVTASMQTLAMEGGQLAVQVTPYEDTALPRPHGFDQVAFSVSTNPGQPMGNLSDIVSGGELSRISLAIQVLTATAQPTPTLIFDEVDVGIGGTTASMVGKLLRQLGEHCQVLCVTHLPQVASQAQQHIRVNKLKSNDQTTSQVTHLDDAMRIEELARMLGGETITDHTREHAKALLQTTA